MEITVSEEGNAVVLTLSGDVNIASSPDLRTAFQKELGKKVERVFVHLAAVNYMDSSGIGVLVSGLKMARKKSVPFGLVDVSKNVMAVMEVTRLTKLFPIYDDLATGLAELGN